MAENILDQIKENPDLIKDAAMQNPESVRLALGINPQLLKVVQEQTPDICFSACLKDMSAYQHIKDESVKNNVFSDFKKMIQNDPYIVLDYENATAEMWEIACGFNGDLIEHAPFQTETMVVNSLENKPDVVKYVNEEYLREGILLYPVSKDPSIIGLIDKKYHTEDICIEAVSGDADVYDKCGVHTRSVKDAAIEQNAMIVFKFEDRSITDEMIAIQKNALVYIRLRNEGIDKHSLRKLALSSDGNLLKYFNYKELSLDEIYSALKANGEAIQFIPEKYRTDEMWDISLDSNGEAIEFKEVQTQKDIDKALASNEMAIAKIKDASQELRIEQIQKNYKVIGVLENTTELERVIACDENVKAFGLLDKHSSSLAVACINEDIDSISHLKFSDDRIAKSIIRNDVSIKDLENYKFDLPDSVYSDLKNNYEVELNKMFSNEINRINDLKEGKINLTTFSEGSTIETKRYLRLSGNDNKEMIDSVNDKVNREKNAALMKILGNEKLDVTKELLNNPSLINKDTAEMLFTTLDQAQPYMEKGVLMNYQEALGYIKDDVAFGRTYEEAIEKRNLNNYIKVDPDVVKELPEVVKYANVNLDERLGLIRRNPDIINELDNISFGEYKTALKVDGYALRHIPAENQNEELIRIAIKEDEASVQFAVNPSSELKKELLEENPKLYSSFQNKTIDDTLIFIENKERLKGSILKEIPENLQTPEVIYKVVSNNPEEVTQIKDFSLRNDVEKIIVNDKMKNFEKEFLNNDIQSIKTKLENVSEIAKDNHVDNTKDNSLKGYNDVKRVGNENTDLSDQKKKKGFGM